MKCEICDKNLTGTQTKFCSLECKNRMHQDYNRQKEKALKRKLYLIDLLGGACNLCDYKKNLAALCFHHLKDKKFKLDSRNLSNRTWSSIEAEALKCQLLCSNCHMEIHNPTYEFEL